MTAKGGRLGARSLWLLRYMQARYPLGITRGSHLPDDNPGVSMLTVSGLIRAGLMQQAGGLYRLTERGCTYQTEEAKR